MSEFWRNKNVDIVIEDIIDIFSNIDGVELVRLSGLTNRAKKLSGIDFAKNDIEIILNKLKSNGIINYKYITICPHCEEKSYQIVDIDISKPKICDSCKIIYQLFNGTTLIKK